MRFRLATSGLSDGVGRGMNALFALPYMRAQAEDEARTAGMRRDLLSSQIANQVAETALRQKKADALGSTGDVLGTVIASQAGTDLPTFNRWRESVRTGVAPTSSASGDAATDEAIGITTAPALDPAVTQKLAREYGRLAPGFINPEDYTVQGQSQAAGNYQEQDLLADLLAGRVQPARAGAAVAATKGQPLVTNIGNTGIGYDRFTGQGTTIDPALRALFGQEGAALVNQRNAAAGASGASRDLSNARRERVAGGYDKPVTVLDDDTGEANITRIPTGAEPVTVGVAPKKGTGVDATNAKERNRVTTAVEKELVGATDAEIQTEVERRMARRGTPSPSTKAAAAPAAPALDMAKANDIKAKVKSGALSREQGLAQLRALGFK